jgi:photosystem II stability/assembly factor-like uncharacterized protein
MKQFKLSSLAGTLLLALLTCMLGACNPSQNTGTTDHTPVPNGATPSPQLQNLASPLKALRLLDHSKGWALTDRNILFTTDGGQQWNDVTPSRSIGSINRGTFMNDKYVWAVSAGQTNSVNIWRTSDGGQHWQSSTISVNGPEVLGPPDFLTTQEGFLEISAGGPGAGSEQASIFHTTDGGQNWTNISELPHGGLKTGITFKDAQNGWATGEDASAIPWLYVTHDGGHTWNQQQLADLPGSTGTASTSVHYTTTPPVFFGDNGFLPIQVQGQLDTNAASQVNGIMILNSTDGGASWSTDWKTNPNTLTTFASNDLYIESTQNAWATDQDGNVYRTSDAGENWSKLASHIDTLKALSFVDASYGWAISDTKLWQTTDGGSHWNQITITYHIVA